ARPAVAEVGHEHGVVLEPARRHPGTRGLADLRADRRADADEVDAAVGVVHRHLPALAEVAGVAEPLVDDVVEARAAQQEHAGLAVRGEHPVGVAQRGCRADVARLLPLALQVEPDAPLALQGEAAIVEDPRRDHRAIQLVQQLDGEVRVLVLRGLAVLLDDAQQLGHRSAFGSTRVRVDAPAAPGPRSRCIRKYSPALYEDRTSGPAAT